MSRAFEIISGLLGIIAGVICILFTINLDNTAPFVLRLIVIVFASVITLYSLEVIFSGITRSNTVDPNLFHFSSSYIVTGTLAQKYMIAICFEGATKQPFQHELPSNRTCVYFGNNGCLSFNNTDPEDVTFYPDSDNQLGVRITDLNGFIQFNPNKFGSMVE